MKRIARFEKVSIDQYLKDCSKENAKEIYEDIKLPTRATKNSAGYDFYLPYDITLNPGCEIKIETGIRVFIEDGYYLSIVPRSSLGFKFRLCLNNTVGIIDSDYYNALNEGHIFIKISNDSNDKKIIELKKGEAFAQGIFMEYLLTYDDDSSETRIGGIGSTSGNK